MPKSVDLLRFFFIFYIIPVAGIGSDSLRVKIKHTYDKEVGVREKTNHNDGAQVETYLHYCNLTKGNPWCASFVCWVFGKNNITNPRSGYCPDLFNSKHVIYKRTSKEARTQPKPGDVWGLYFPEKGRVAHVGFIDQWQNKYIITVEGNTNETGSREGDGVYRKRRSVKSIYVVANYIDKK